MMSLYSHLKLRYLIEKKIIRSKVDKYNQCELFVALQLYSDSLKHKYNYCVICLGTIFIIANLLIGLAQLDDIIPMILVGRVMGGIGVGTYNYFYFMYV